MTVGSATSRSSGLEIGHLFGVPSTVIEPGKPSTGKADHASDVRK